MRLTTTSRRTKLIGLVATGALALGTLAASPVQAAPPVGGDDRSIGAAAQKGTADNLLHPLAAKQAGMRQEALQRRVQGDPSAQGATVNLATSTTARKGSAAKGRSNWVQLEREGTDKVFVVIAEFGDTRHPAYCDSTAAGSCTYPSDGTPQKYDGPAHNQIPKPDRSVDNSTLWKSNYSKAHYENMYFNRMKKYYERQSSGRFSLDGQVTEWVKVPFNQARYGRDWCGGIVCNNTWFLLRDAMSLWTQERLDEGMTMAEITAYLSTFDVQDRYDFDGDGNFREPDGFIDHFQIVHAGGDQAAGDPIYASDAIWSHRWYAQLATGGPGGLPGFNIGSGGPTGGITVPDNPTGVWVGDYTIQPENGGLGVFAHEFGHDLGLPDLYDTSGNTGGAENSTGFWTLMSSGANIGDGGNDGIGDDPTDLGAWEKFQLGWLSPQGDKGPFYDVAFAGETSKHKVGRNDTATVNGTQALFVVLPDKQVPLTLGDPYAGEYMFWSTQGDELETTMSHAAAPGALTAKVKYSIEVDWDYAYLEASPDGATWTPVATNRSTTTDPNGQNQGQGITGSTADAWVDLTGTLPAGTTAMRFRYWTDVAVSESGFQVDEIALNGTTVGTAETDTEGFTFDGFVRTTGAEVQEFFNAYVAENRQYDGYDTSLKTAYNFGFLNTLPDFVEKYRYQNGLLINYWDGSYGDNNVGDHPGGGLVLPVDANPRFAHSYDGHLLRPRILSYDSTFGLERVESITVHKDGKPTTIPGKAAVPVFNDMKDYWFDSDRHAATGSHVGRYQPGWSGVKVPKTGTKIAVTGQRGYGWVLDVTVN